MRNVGVGIKVIRQGELGEVRQFGRDDLARRDILQQRATNFGKFQIGFARDHMIG